MAKRYNILTPAPLPFWLAEQLRPRWRVVAEAAAAAAIAAAAVASIAAAAVASMAAEVTVEVMASMARPWLLVRAAGGMPTGGASAGGDIGSIAV
jgi:hypothetical protein